MKATDYIVRFLEACGIEYVFGYQGGMITHLVDSLSKSCKVKFVQCYHEQSAAFAAEGYARASGKFGVCITTSGPGATNAVTGMGDAYFDSVPVLYISGQVNTYEYKYGAMVRQRGFQETDIVSIARPIMKWARLADDPARLAEDLAEAVRTMLSGRKGPVLIDLPMDVQRAELADEEYLRAPRAAARMEIADTDAEAVAAALSKANRPFVICGGGASDPEVSSLAAEFLSRTGIPYAVSLMGKGNVSEDAEGFVGMIGSYGNRAANLALSESDLVLCVGSRLDLRQTGNRKLPLLNNILFVRIDVDGHEATENPMPNQLHVHADVTSFFRHPAARRLGRLASGDWHSRTTWLGEVRSQHEDVERHAANKTPYKVLEAISRHAAEDALFTVDIGQNQMWSAQTLSCGSRRSFMTSGGMAPMGYAIPVAVGAAFANPGRQVVCICGDGGFHIALQSLMLISQYKLPICVIVMNNRALGMITQFQSLYFNGNMAGTTENGGYAVPDIECLARAYGLPYRLVRSAADIEAEAIRGPSLVEVDLGGLTTVVPKLEFNKALDDMTPAWPLDDDA